MREETIRFYAALTKKELRERVKERVRMTGRKNRECEHLVYPVVGVHIILQVGESGDGGLK
jgi:hypothetical protein